MTKLHTFYSEDAWIEGSSVEQLATLEKSYPDIIGIAAMPDLHPGKYGPVGIGMLSEDVHPSIVGSDIGCGMSLFTTNINARKLRLDKLAERMKALDEPWDGDASEEVRLASLPPSPYDIGLGSIGLGNHFCEFQTVNEIFDPEAASAAGIEEDDVFILVHSGSRALGYSVFDPIIREGTLTLKAGSDAAEAYIAAHDHAVAWASLNRAIIAQRAADEANSNQTGVIADISHNFLERTASGFLHRKGAATASKGLVPIPGSRETLSYLVKPCADAPAEALGCLAHGAGRKYDRGAMHGRILKAKSVREKMSRNPFGGLVICEDRNLLIEEASAAYKNVDAVISQLTGFGLSTPVASFKPLLTFKTGYSSAGERDRR